MYSNQQVGVHYISTGFPYSVTGSFVNLFEGLPYAQANFALHNQGGSFWSMMHASSYKYGFSGPLSSSYYNYSHTYGVNDHIARFVGGRQQLDAPSLNDWAMPQLVQHSSEGADASANPTTEECINTQYTSNSPQVIWQDNIDPDNMTYEELLDLGEAVGTQSRGLSQELISSLPISKYKFNFFSRMKARRERCVICQMHYKRGDRQMTLPCKHVYHADCVGRWLSINKACPVCTAEVFSDEPKH